MKRWIATAAVLVVAAIAAVFAVRLHDGSGLPNLAGEWKSWRSAFRISREGDGYSIVVDNPSGFLGGVYAGKVRGDVVAVTGPLAPLCREIRYVKEGDKLQFCGEEFERVGREAAASDGSITRVGQPLASSDRAPSPASTSIVGKAACGPGSRPESALQGQVPPPLRRVGQFNGFNCNLQLLGQSRGEGAGWQAAFFRDRAGHVCAYYDTAPSTAGRAHHGVVVVDATDPAKPVATNYLSTPAMVDPLESLKVNERRALLMAVSGVSERTGANVDIYDIGDDCRSPRLLSRESTAASGPPAKAGERATEGDFSPDGRTYYATNLRSGTIHPIDVGDPANPKVLVEWSMPFNQRTSGLAIGGDGNRAYFTLYGRGAAAGSADESKLTNGIVIADVSDVQARKAKPQVKVISTLVWGDGSASHQVFPIRIQGKAYLVATDEGGSGDSNASGWTAACDAGLPPWSMARIIDIGDEVHPAIVSEMKLEMNDAANCKNVLPDLVGLSGFTYGSHYCSVDDPEDATTLACAYFESGIRVFDIRDPRRPREIAYFVPPAVTSPSPGSFNNATTASGRPDHCSAQLRFDARMASLMTTCRDNGFLALRFTNGAWPFRR
jgi:hypothetical protein